MRSVPRPSLVSIVAYARAGALEHAWRLFREAGLEGADEPAALALKGRLLKDRAVAASGEARRGFYLEAAAAYGRAAELADATYPRINAASLSLLAGDAATARRHAEAVLARLSQEEADTPYWREATRAEALLVLGRIDDAKAALQAAVAVAPEAWEDHASTLRQFGLILEALGADAAWLAPLRPPRTLHFAGHTALAADDRTVRQEIDTLLERERIGFGYGALAAGADIVVAEALVARGAELHLVLPAPPEVFREASVATAGDDWAARFDRLLAEAASVKILPPAPTPAEPLAVQLAAEVAMGEAAMKAQQLMTEAVQLVVLESAAAGGAEPGSSGWARTAWAASGRRQRIVAAARHGAPAKAGPARDKTLALAALLAVEAPTPDALHDILRAEPGGDGRWAAGILHLAYDTPRAAADAARLIQAGAGEGLRIGGHYGLVETANDPFGGGVLRMGPAAALPPAILAATAPGGLQVSETFAAALQAASAEARTEYVGTLPWADGEQALHAVRA